jgi:polysaccharide biosynthesis transport protein
VNELAKNSSHDLQSYLTIACRRRWWLISAVFLSWATVVAVSRFLPARYRSETVILVEQDKLPERYVAPNVSADLQERLQSITQPIMSSPRLQDIIERNHLYSHQQGGKDASGLVDRMRDDIKIELVPAQGRADELLAFKVSYSAEDPKLAQQITGELMSLFIEDNRRTRQQLSDSTTEFLQSEVEDAKRKLNQQQAKLRDFKSRFINRSNVQILSRLEKRLQSAAEALTHAEQQRLYLNSLRDHYELLQGGSGGNTEAAAGSLAVERELGTLKNQLAELRSRYSSRHPEVVRLKQKIAATEKLKEQIEEEIRSGKTSAAGADLPTTPADMQATTQRLRIESQMKANQLEITNRKHQIASIESEIKQYEARLNLTPVREQQLAAITRDYQQLRTNYESLLAKKQQSELAAGLDKRQQGEQFRVVESPGLPRKPYSPDRFSLSLAGLGLGIVLAGGIAAALHMFDARIYRESQLRQFVSVPVLVGIPPLWTAAEKQKRLLLRWAEIMAASAMLVSVSLVTALAYYRG